MTGSGCDVWLRDDGGYVACTAAEVAVWQAQTRGEVA